MNGYCAKLGSNLDAKVGLLTLSDSRQHKKCVFSIFIILTSLRLESFENGESQVRCLFLEEGGSCGNGEELKTAHR